MKAIFVRDLKLMFRAGGGALTGVLFFLALIMTIPFGTGPDLKLLAKIGAAVLWIGALLASLITLERLFREDRDDGSLDLMVLNGYPLSLLVLAKCMAHWLVTGLPLVLAAPLFGLMMNMDVLSISASLFTLLVGTPAITFIGALGAAITVILPRGGGLSAILTLPLTIPVLIFATSAVRGATEEPAPFTAPFLLLCSLSLIYALIGTMITAWTLKQAV